MPSGVRRASRCFRVRNRERVFTTENAEGSGKNGREARRHDTEYVSDYTVLSPTRRKRSPFVIQSQRAKNLNRTHICRTSVAEPRKPCFTPQQAKIRRETGTLPFMLFNQSAADLGFFAIVKGGHLNTVD